MRPTPVAVEDIHKPSNRQDGWTAIWTENVWVYLVSTLEERQGLTIRVWREDEFSRSGSQT